MRRTNFWAEAERSVYFFSFFGDLSLKTFLTSSKLKLHVSYRIGRFDYRLSLITVDANEI